MQTRRSAVQTLLDADVLNDTQTAVNSAAVDCERFRRFILYLSVDSASTPTDLRFIVQFSNDGGTTWYDYKQGPFASLYYEDQDTASGVYECFSGEVAGHEMRLRAVGSGTTASATFTVSAGVEFYD